MLREWDKLPDRMKNDDVRRYYDILKKRKLSLFIKRAFDIIMSAILLIVISPLLLILVILIKLDSQGSVFFRQERITRYGKSFKIFKFRTMIANAEKIGSQITISNDSRITRIGRVLRKYRLDEVPQCIDILRGTMTFVGTRPEVPKYIDRYTPEMMATLLLPAGVTSEASIIYKDEAKLLDNASDVDETYTDIVLPAKMIYNLKSIERFHFGRDIKILFMTILAVCGKEYGDTDH